AYLYIERSLQEVILSGEKSELDKIRKKAISILKVNRVAYLSHEHFLSLTKAWNKNLSKTIHSAIGSTIIIPNLCLESKNKSFQLFLDITKLLILDNVIADEKTEQVANLT
ncbi:MAG: hypothetical protein KDD56_04155, partial [Bdellovibrionales bacterium]|nr:hypothetical protein [Bdellovibrionales bacterium]